MNIENVQIESEDVETFEMMSDFEMIDSMKYFDKEIYCEIDDFPTIAKFSKRMDSDWMLTFLYTDHPGVAIREAEKELMKHPQLRLLFLFE